MLDLRRLRFLSELARRGTIAEVARVAGYTPSAISQSLTQLEREIGVPLLERDGRRVRLTPAAHGLVARTDRFSPSWTPPRRSSPPSTRPCAARS
jgi:DNA-binding transcriptional LysR family regulator